MLIFTGYRLILYIGTFCYLEEQANLQTVPHESFRQSINDNTQ